MFRNDKKIINITKMKMVSWVHLSLQRVSRSYKHNRECMKNQRKTLVETSSIQYRDICIESCTGILNWIIIL